jgi:hypothetical protein
LPVAVGVVLLSATILLLTNESTLAALRGESITVRPIVTDLGEGRAGDTRSFRIELMNHSDKAIRMIGGNKRCGCVPTDDLPVTLLPGKSTSVNVRMSFGGSPGRFQRGFVLYADDEMQPVVTARFNGNLIEE